ncbi:MAG TPA: FAD-dependent monooxygenase [Steroidobacteraceae bacterium]|nr:FAD-dependent monooxygenase [Steroidobacteraceae bacterium]
MAASEVRIPVLVVGGGLAGLTTTLMLAWRGVPALLVERHSDTSKNPRARGVNFRSMELLRVAGLEPDLMAEGGAMKDFSIIIAETVTGRELRTLLPRGSWDSSDLTPAQMSGAGQDRVEPILRRHAEALGADVRYATELVEFEQDGSGLTATIRDLHTRAESTVRADYMVGADGNRSSVRQRLGIGMQGAGTLSHNMAIVFEADLEPALRGRSLALYYLQNPGFTGAFINTERPNRALVSVEYNPDKNRPADFDERRCTELVRAALGIPDLEVNILEVTPWEMASRTAERYTQGRVFLAGDAAHTMPPTGGLGGQTAIQDGYDLAWKLALVLHGQADEQLLATYEAERKPVGAMTVALQTANYIERLRPDRQDLKPHAEPSDYLGVAFGYRYRSPAILQDGADDGSPVEDPGQPCGRPGTRGAHVVFQHRGKEISSLDLIGRDFVLLTGPEGAAWARAGTLLAYNCAVPLSVYRVGSDLLDVYGKWTQRYGVTAAGAVLLRPDGYIAWRARTAASSAASALYEAFTSILFRAPDKLTASRADHNRAALG